jgi:hypothetical protein
MGDIADDINEVFSLQSSIFKAIGGGRRTVCHVNVLVFDVFVTLRGAASSLMSLFCFITAPRCTCA